MTQTEVKARVRAEVKRCLDVARDKYPRANLSAPTVKFDKKGTTAGTARDSTYTINLNLIIMIDNPDSIEDTTAHEFAHLVDGVVNPETRETNVVWDPRRGARRTKRDIHGATWKSIMILFGFEPARCHNLDVSRARVRSTRSTKVHVWKCGCGDGIVILTPNKHAKQLAAKAGYGYYKRGHTSNRCGKYSYFGIEGKEINPMYPTTVRPVAVAANAAKPTLASVIEDINTTQTGVTADDIVIVRGIPSSADDGRSKLAICRDWYTPGAGKKGMINLFVIKAGCTPAGASTYYYKLKAEHKKSMTMPLQHKATH